MWGIATDQLVHFSKSLSLMLHSGMALDESLTELAEQTSSARFRTVLMRVRQEVESGVSLADAMEKNPHVFKGVMLAVVRAGEASGTLEENLNFLSEWLEHNADIRREVHGAMLYPAIVFTATIGVSGCLSLLVLPRLLPIFAQMTLELPLSTRILLWVTDALQNDWPVIVASVAACTALFISANKILSVRRVCHATYLHVPFVGSMLRQYQLTLIGQIFTTLFCSGLSIFEILEVAARGATNLTYKDALLDVSERVQRGTTLADALRSYPSLFPREYTSIIAVGEKSGSLEESFRYLTEYYRKAVYAATKRLPTVIEPVLLLLMGLLVVFIAVSIVLPIYQFTANVHH